ncbi:MAG: DUF3048 domain-containing protein [Roseiflexaceae bacterium]|mgnify:CR=1 FL=1|nr:DUF3048 domain-containing protein [Roseiflexaceae bacterium]
MHASNVSRLLLITSFLGLLIGCAGQASVAPTSAPAIVPTSAPVAAPTVAPTVAAATEPTVAPTVAVATEPTVAPTVAVATEPTSAPAVSSVGGVALVRGSIIKRPYVVMIDNHPNAYPQSGLDKATVVFEALAEFGLTRFMAVYAPGISPDVTRIGPVRSTRLYFAQWALPLGAVYVHAGGSPQGLALVESSQLIMNVDALFRANGNYFSRDDRRVAPHNLYTSTSNLDQAAASGNAQPIRSDVGFLFKAEAPVAQRPVAQILTYFFLYSEDAAGWVYDPASNSYSRLRRGKPAIDAESGAQLRAKNVVVMEVKEAPITGDEKGRIEQQVVGSGKARVFVDGIEREITWHKDTPESPLLFLDGSNQEIQFNIGQIWIVALPTLDNLKVS